MVVTVRFECQPRSAGWRRRPDIAARASMPAHSAIFARLQVKRSIVVTLVVLALVILISPGVVGWLAERNLQQGIEQAKTDSPDVVVTTERFDRGWFTSEGRHRVSLRHAGVAANGMKSLIIDTRFDHGLLPVSSMSLSSGSLKPGLARMVSTLHLDDGQGNLTELPGTIYSETSLGGDTTGRYVLEAGSRDDAHGTATWSGADLQFTASDGHRELSVKGEVQPWSYQAGANSAEVGKLTVDARQVKTDFGIAVGDVIMVIESFAVAGEAGPLSGFQKLDINGTSAIDGDEVNARTRMSLQKLVIPEFGEIGISMDVAVNGLDAAALGRISKAADEARASDDPDAALGDLFSVIQGDLESMLASGGEIRLDQLDIALPQGDIRSKMTLAVAESSGAFSWPGTIMATTASADISVAEALVQMGLEMNPDAASLIDMGFLKLEGDVYRMQAEFAGGLLTVNGAPLPIPLPGQ
jgi:uncharacterized protein YdgA (DUF945 family)